MRSRPGEGGTNRSPMSFAGWCRHVSAPLAGEKALRVRARGAFLVPPADSPLTDPSHHRSLRAGQEVNHMAKTLAEFRAQNLHVLQQLCPDDPAYVRHWMRAFDAHHGIKSEATRPTSRAIRPAGAGKSRRKLARH